MVGRATGGQRVVWLLWSIGVGVLVGCGGGSAAHRPVDAGDGGADHRDAAAPRDAPGDSPSVHDAATGHDAGPTGPAIQPGFNAFEAMQSPRFGHTATLLANGQVLIAGGQDSIYTTATPDIESQTTTHTLATAEVHDPAAGTSTATGPLTTARYNHTATMLPSGKVLLVGGAGDSSILGSAELYDPATQSFTAVGSLNVARMLHTATLLPGGQVLIAGGRGSSGDPVPGAELYDPATGAFTTTGALLSPRYQHTATLLGTGKVLIAGGYKFGTTGVMATAELYDPATGMFSATGPLSVARYNHTATMLGSGKVLIAGGQGNNSSTTGAAVDYVTAELYDPATGTFSATGSMATARLTHTATLLSDGSVLMAGGINHIGAYTYLFSAEVYHPDSGTFSPAPPLVDVRFGHTATALPDGRVFLAGGNQQDTPIELYDPRAPVFRSSGICRINHTATVLADQRVLFAGGRSSWFFGNAALYDPALMAFVPTGQMLAVREAHTATLLADGRVFIVGGVYDGSESLAGEIYSPATGTFTATALPVLQRTWHTATLLPDGRVLIAGGDYAANPSSSSELFDPAKGTFTATGSLVVARDQHTATMLQTGQVLIAGGLGASAALASAELYDPTKGTFAATGTMKTGRFGHSATLLADGRVLMIGGWTGTATSGGGLPTSYQGQATATAEIYDPATGSFSPVGALNHPSYDHAAALRSDGTVLVVGGVDLAVPPGWDLVPSASLNRAELYQPSAGTFSSAGTMHFPRYAPTATTLSTGDVLIVGGSAAAMGWDGNFRLGLVELYR